MRNIALFSAITFTSIAPASAQDLGAKLSPELQQQSRCVAWAVLVEQERQDDQGVWPEFPDTSGKVQALAGQLAEQISEETGADRDAIRGYFRGRVEEVQNMAFLDKTGEHGQPLENPDAPAQFKALSKKCAPVISKLLEK